MKKQIIILAIITVLAVLVFVWLSSIRKNLEKTAYRSDVEIIAATVTV